MAIHWMDRVWKESKADGAALLLLLKIADNANDRGMAYPGINYLAEHVRMSERTIPRLIQKLEEMGELAVARGAGRSNTNRYYILTGRPEAERKAILEACKPQEEAIKPDKKGDKLSGFTEQKGDNENGKGDKKSVKGDKNDVKGDTAMSPEPLTLNQEGEPEDIEPEIQKPEPDRQVILTSTLQSMSFEKSTGEFIKRFVLRPEVVRIRDDTWTVAVGHPPDGLRPGVNLAAYLFDRFGPQLERSLAAMACEGRIQVEFVERANGRAVRSVLDAVPAAVHGHAG